MQDTIPGTKTLLCILFIKYTVQTQASPNNTTNKPANGIKNQPEEMSHNITGLLTHRKNQNYWHPKPLGTSTLTQMTLNFHTTSHAAYTKAISPQ